MKNIIVAVIGGHTCNVEVEQLTHEIGENIAKIGLKLVCGGLGGVMLAASKAAKQAGGTVIGILPGDNNSDANQYVDIAIPTGIGLARNTIVVRTADVVIALPGEYGTLSEIAFARILKKPVINLSNWDIPGTIKVKTASEAIKELKRIINKGIL